MLALPLKKKRGKKIIVYGASGMGKTTLATMTPNPVFVAVDELSQFERELFNVYCAKEIDPNNPPAGFKSIFRKDK